MAEFFRGLRILSVGETKQYDCPYPADPEDQEPHMGSPLNYALPKTEFKCSKCQDTGWVYTSTHKVTGKLAGFDLADGTICRKRCECGTEPAQQI